MDAEFVAAADAILERASTGEPRVPGLVAMATDREGNIYEGVAGVRRLGDKAPMTADSVFALFSLSKAITGTAVLQLVEQGRLDLDAPAKRYAPAIGALEVLEGFDEAGGLKLRAPKREITTRMLMLHTAGFGYDFFNAALKRLTTEHTQPDPRLGTKRGLMCPLLFDPGERWEYGIGIDWCGQVVEGIVGERLDAVLKARVFEPLGMADADFVLSPSMRARRASMHRRDKTGALLAIDFELPETPEVFMGGGALFATAGDYMRFLRMWLSDGAGENGRVLKPETVAMAARPASGHEDQGHAVGQPRRDA
jgi:methyl acetate hydrolase